MLEDARVTEATPSRWVLPPVMPDDARTITDWPLLSAILYHRGVRSRDEAERFLNPLRGKLADPSLLPDLDRAAEMISAAASSGERIAVFGDYDVDGLSSTAMLVRVFRRLGAEVIPMIPHRMDDGYGLTTGSAARIASSGVRLVVTVDCGSSSPNELEMLLAHGIQPIVVDHHHYSGALPPAVPFVSPKRPDNSYPCEHLAAVGVAYMLARRLLGDEDAEMYLPYVALGTVCDVVDMRGENRTLVAKGISKLRRWKLPGLMALCAAAGIDQAAVTTWHIGYLLGPRINAAGRVASPQVALDLLLADDATTATPLALELTRLNELRQAETRRMQDEADELIRSNGWLNQHPSLVLAAESWSIGIAGLVAGRLADAYHRPVIVLEQGSETSRGSARSGGAVDIVEAIEASAALLDRFGGHRDAAGLSLPTARIDELREQLAATVFDLCGGRFPARSIEIDAVASLDELSLDTVDLLSMLEPFGRGNEMPNLMIQGVRHRYAKTSKDGRHLLLTAIDDRGRGHKAVFFGAGHRLDEVRSSTRLDLVSCLQRDTWDGRTRLKLHLRDLRPGE